MQANEIKTEPIDVEPDIYLESDICFLVQYKDPNDEYLMNVIVNSNEIILGDSVIFKDANNQTKVGNLLYCGESFDEVDGHLQNYKDECYKKLCRRLESSLLIHIGDWLLVQYNSAHNAVLFRIIRKPSNAFIYVTDDGDITTHLTIDNQMVKATVLRVSYTDQDLKEWLMAVKTNHSEFTAKIGANVYCPSMVNPETNTLTDCVQQIIQETPTALEYDVTNDMMDLERKMYDEALALDCAFQEVQRVKSQMQRKLAKLKRKLKRF